MISDSSAELGGTVCFMQAVALHHYIAVAMVKNSCQEKHCLRQEMLQHTATNYCSEELKKAVAVSEEKI